MSRVIECPVCREIVAVRSDASSCGSSKCRMSVYRMRKKGMSVKPIEVKQVFTNDMVIWGQKLVMCVSKGGDVDKCLSDARDSLTPDEYRVMFDRLMNLGDELAVMYADFRVIMSAVMDDTGDTKRLISEFKDKHGENNLKCAINCERNHLSKLCDLM